MVTPHRIRLSEWARSQGIHPKTALRWAHEDRVPGAVQAASGRWLVEVDAAPNDHVVLYGRVSSSDQKADLERQLGRLRDFAAARGLTVTKEISEVGSGLNGARRGLAGVLSDGSVQCVVVEHRDRLARFGVEYIEAALAAQGRTIIIVNEGEQKLDIVQDFIDVVTSLGLRKEVLRALS